MQVTVGGEAVQFSGGECLLQVAQEQSTEHPRQHPDRQEEPRPARDPAFAVRCDPAARDKEMNVWVMQEILPPGVQHTEEADLGAEMLGIHCDGAQGLRRRPEQDIVDHGLVLERDGGDQVRHREHHVEVGHVEQFRLTVLEPLGASETLALRAVSIATRVVGDTLMAAAVAALDVTAESCAAATLDRDHGAPPGGGQRAMLITKSRAEVAEDIRHFQPLAGHGGRASGGHEVRRVGHQDVE
jgi:hypothetical protein